MMKQTEQVAHVRFIDERTEATALVYLKFLRDQTYFPMASIEGGIHPASNSELRRWLNKGSVSINNTSPKPGDMVQFPIMQLVFFSGSSRQSTVIYETD